YTVSALAEFSALSSSKLEEAELLEQNRWIENGGRIKVAVVKDKGLAIDTPEDLEKVIKQIQQ
ncbi:MAG: 3-deoxy-manno-octulosonate cytidylyltransferase (CMP-KDO synthetase), partial [Parvicellaceae bacterium]